MDNAVTGGLLTVSNNQFVDKFVGSTWQNPYQTQAVFAISPALHSYTGRSFQLKLPSNLWFTNNATIISNFAVDYGDGSGYHTIVPDQAITVNYADTGTKTWKFRLNLTNGTSLYSQTAMRVQPEPNMPYSGATAGAAIRPQGTRSSITPLGYSPSNPTQLLTADAAYNGLYGQGWITVNYANSDLKLRKPLIVVEGFDPGYLLEPEKQYGESNYNTFLQQLVYPAQYSPLTDLLTGSLQQYDIIYVDWKAGADYLQRNGLLLERVIRWVNEKKAADGVSTQPNVVLGQSMGGVIGRWTLKDMEQKGLNHQTRLFINWDGPQQGANVPLAYQYLSRHARSLYVQSNIPFLLNAAGAVSNTVAVFGNTINNALNLSDFPAPQQMLMNHLNANFTIDNSMHTAWQQELQAKGYPANCRNVAVSNGSECAYNQGFAPDATLLSVNGKAGTTFLIDFIKNVEFPFVGGMNYATLAILLNRPQFLVGILPGKSTLAINFLCKAQPGVGTTDQIYNGVITFAKKLLGLINITTTITNKSFNSNPSIIPVDGSPGGFYDIRTNLQNSSFQSVFAKYNLVASNIPQFNFVPTTSSLDIGSGITTLTTNDYNARYIGGQPPVAPYKSPFSNFTTAFSQNFTSALAIDNNEPHIEITPRNGNWVAAELNGSPIQSNCSAICGNNMITGPAILCTNATYTVIDPGPGGSVSWSVSPTGIVTPNSGSGPSITLTKISSANGIVTLTATSTNACGSQSIAEQISMGGPIRSLLSITPNGGIYCSGPTSNAEFDAVYNGDHTGISYLWSVTPAGSASAMYTGAASDGSRLIVTFQQKVNTYFPKIWLTAQNSCGTTSFGYVPVEVDNCPGLSGLMLSPNPANTIFTIQQNQTGALDKGVNTVSGMAASVPFQKTFNTETINGKVAPEANTQSSSDINKVRIFDMAGKLLKTIEGPATKQVHVNVSGLSNGIYIVEITSGTNIERQKVLVLH